MWEQGLTLASGTSSYFTVRWKWVLQKELPQRSSRSRSEYLKDIYKKDLRSSFNTLARSKDARIQRTTNVHFTPTSSTDRSEVKCDPLESSIGNLGTSVSKCLLKETSMGKNIDSGSDLPKERILEFCFYFCR